MISRLDIKLGPFYSGSVAVEADFDLFKVPAEHREALFEMIAQIKSAVELCRKKVAPSSEPSLSETVEGPR